MLPRDQRCSRRKFLASTAAIGLGAGAASARSTSDAVGVDRVPIAVLGSVYRPLSYLYHLAGRFIHGYPRDGRHHLPAQRIQSLWLDQIPENDLSREICNSFGIRRSRTVRDALIENGRLAVQGVLIVVEHGNYPRNDLGQILYPRAEVFEQVVDAFRSVGQTAPVFIAKHLSHDLAKARRMVQSARDLGFPLMAGSALPAADRSPAKSLHDNSNVSDALVAGYGPVEVHGFDAIEALLALMPSGVGVTAVSCLTGADVWNAGDRGEWSWPLLNAALACGETVNLGDVRRNVGRITLPGMPAIPPIAFQAEFSKGARGTALLLNGHIQEFVAATVAGTGSPAAFRFVTPPAPGVRHFDRHASEIEEFLTSGRSPTPIARTLLATTVLHGLMESRALGGHRIAISEVS